MVYIRARLSTTTDRNLNFGAPSPLDFFEVSPADFSPLLQVRRKNVVVTSQAVMFFFGLECTLLSGPMVYTHFQPFWLNSG